MIAEIQRDVVLLGVCRGLIFVHVRDARATSLKAASAIVKV